MSESRGVHYGECDAVDLCGLLDGVKRHPVNAQIGIARGDNMPGGPKWYGGITSTSQVADLFQEGWAEGAAKVQRLSEQVQAPTQTATVVRRRSVYSDQGDELDGWRAMAGDWDVAWQRQSAQERIGPRVVSIAGTWGGSYNRSADELFWQGAQMIVAADLLEQAGYAVEVVALLSTSIYATHFKIKAGNGKMINPSAKSLWRITVKRSDEPLRPDQVAAIFCHAGTFRTAGFEAVCTAPFDVGHGLGAHATAEACYAQAKGDKVIPAAPDFILPDAYTPQQAAANIAGLIAKLEAAAGAA